MMTITIRSLSTIDTQAGISDDALTEICERLGIIVYHASCGPHIIEQDIRPLRQLLEVRAVLIQRNWTPDAVDGILPCLWKSLSGKLPRRMG